MDVHGNLELWTASLDSTAGSDRSVLSEDELEWAARLRFESDSFRFVASRVWLRRLLAARLQIGPGEIRFQARAGGKPELAPPLPAWLRFNMSRSGPLGLYALARSREVGVDLESTTPVLDVDVVASRFLSPDERAAVGRQEGQPQRGFYRMWTRKEAALKAMGIGLDAPLEALDASGDVARWDPAAVDAPTPYRRWFVHDLDVAPGYAAALACEWALPHGTPPVRDATRLFPAS